MICLFSLSFLILSPLSLSITSSVFGAQLGLDASSLVNTIQVYTYYSSCSSLHPTGESAIYISIFQNEIEGQVIGVLISQTWQTWQQLLNTANSKPLIKLSSLVHMFDSCLAASYLTFCLCISPPQTSFNGPITLSTREPIKAGTQSHMNLPNTSKNWEHKDENRTPTNQ